MAKCGIKKIKIGTKSVPYEHVVSALQAASKETNYDQAVVKSYKELPQSVSMKDWEQWFRRIHDVQKGSAIETKDLIGYEDSENKRANRLRDLLNIDVKGRKHYKLLPETMNAINATKRRLLERGETLNDAQIDALIDGIESAIFVSNLVNKANALKKRAKSAIKRKLGSAPETFPVFNKLVNLDMRGVPVEYRQKYIEVLQELADHSRVLDFSEHGELLDKAKDVLQHSTETKPTKKVKEDDLGEKEVRIKLLKTKKVEINNLPNRWERDVAKTLQNLTEEDLQLLDNRKLQNLLDGIEAIKYGVLPHSVYDIILDIDANRSVSILKPIIEKGPSKSWTQATQKAYGHLKAAVLGGKTNAINEIIRSAPKTVVDELFGNRTTEIFDNVFRKLSVQEDRFTSRAQEIRSENEKIERKLYKKFKGNKNVKIKYKLKLYEKQLEALSNPDLWNAMDYIKRIKAEVKKGSTYYTTKDVQLLEEIVEEFAQDGVFDLEKMEQSFTPIEKEIIETNKKRAQEMQPYVEFTSGVIRGERVETLNNYSASVTVDQDAEADIKNAEARMKGTAKSRNLQERYKDGEKAPLISLDVTGDSARASISILQDFYLTPAIRHGQRTVQRLREQVAGTPGADAATALELSLDESIDNLIVNNIPSSGFGAAALKHITKNAYRAQLASATRAIGEAVSNLSAAVFIAQKALTTAMKTGDWRNTVTMLQAMRNLGSFQITKLYDQGSFGGKWIENTFTDINQARKVKAMTPLQERMLYIQNAVGHVDRVGDKIGEITMSAPDKLISRMVWSGEFVNQFKELTGKNPDWNKIAANDEAYMSEFKQPLSVATKEADRKSAQIGATNNRTTGISKLQYSAKDDTGRTIYKAVNGYLMRFMIFEASTFRTGWNTAWRGVTDGNGGDLKKGAAILAGSSTRMAIYFPLIQLLNGFLFGGDDEEEDFSESFTEELWQGVMTFIFQGKLGAIPRNIMSWPIEEMHAHYVENVLDEDFNPYRDTWFFAPLVGKRKIGDILREFSGPLKPFFKELDKILKDIERAENTKNEDKQILAENSAKFRSLVLFAQYGLGIPLKDINNWFNDWAYKQRKNR